MVPRRSRTTDTAIFSRMLYQLSYLGMPFRLAAGCIGRVSFPVQLVRASPPVSSSVGRLVGRHAIAFLQPAAEIDVGAALGAERPVVGPCRALPQIGHLASMRTARSGGWIGQSSPFSNASSWAARVAPRRARVNSK